MGISLIVAMDRCSLIGRADGALPWGRGKLRKDMERFKKKTTGTVVIMGRKTRDTFARPGEKPKPLPNRTNIVVTRNPCVPDPEGWFEVGGIKEALQVAKEQCPDGKIFIIGGAEIYALFFELVDTIYFTIVHDEFERKEGDVFFDSSPALLDQSKNWRKVGQQKINRDVENKTFWDLTFTTYERVVA